MPGQTFPLITTQPDEQISQISQQTDSCCDEISGLISDLMGSLQSQTETIVTSIGDMVSEFQTTIRQVIDSNNTFIGQTITEIRDAISSQVYIAFTELILQLSLYGFDININVPAPSGPTKPIGGKDGPKDVPRTPATPVSPVKPTGPVRGPQSGGGETNVPIGAIGSPIGAIGPGEPIGGIGAVSPPVPVDSGTCETLIKAGCISIIDANGKLVPYDYGGDPGRPGCFILKLPPITVVQTGPSVYAAVFATANATATAFANANATSASESSAVSNVTVNTTQGEKVEVTCPPPVVNVNVGPTGKTDGIDGQPPLAAQDFPVDLGVPLAWEFWGQTNETWRRQAARWMGGDEAIRLLFPPTMEAGRQYMEKAIPPPSTWEDPRPASEKVDE